MDKKNSAEVFAHRYDLIAIDKLLPPGARILDLGCGDGLFLKYLADTKSIESLGIEIDQDRIIQCIANGVSVIQGHHDGSLDFADDESFDYVILSRTLQEVKRPDKLLSEIVRVGKHAIVSFLNFGHIANRMQILLRGKMPLTGSLPHPWYNTPNIHLGTIQDFKILCDHLGIDIVHEQPIGRQGGILAKLAPNLLAHSCVFVLRKRP